MKVLVCGGREYSNSARVFEVLGSLHAKRAITEIIEGGALGADRLAKTWAQHANVPIRTFPASWGRYGKQAGYVRNQQMLDVGKPDIVVAFPGGRGTLDMKRRARDVVPVLVVTDGPQPSVRRLTASQQ